jgi:DNA modification methylase
LIFTKNQNYKFHKPRIPQKYLNRDPRAKKKNPKGRCLGNVIKIPAYRPPNIKKQNYHIAAFPENLAAFFIECYTDIGDIVLDPFVVSGTTLKVCEHMSRKGIGYEINKDFLDLIKDRIDEDWTKPDWKNLDVLGD